MFLKLYCVLAISCLCFVPDFIIKTYTYQADSFKFSLNIHIGVMHLLNKFGYENRIASCKFMQLLIICK